MGPVNASGKPAGEVSQQSGTPLSLRSIASALTALSGEDLAGDFACLRDVADTVLATLSASVTLLILFWQVWCSYQKVNICSLSTR